MITYDSVIFFFAGHVDSGEDDMTTAYRETEEEAGLKPSHLTVIEGFKRTLNYNVNNKPKRVVYWLARLCNPNTPIILSSEHQDFKWLDEELAKEYAGYEDQKQMIADAAEFIRKNCTEQC